MLTAYIAEHRLLAHLILIKNEKDLENNHSESRDSTTSSAMILFNVQMNE